MHRYEFKVGPYTCLPFGDAPVGGLFITCLAARSRIEAGREIAARLDAKASTER
jgi:hypothetical protein